MNVEHHHMPDLLTTTLDVHETACLRAKLRTALGMIGECTKAITVDVESTFVDGSGIHVHFRSHPDGIVMRIDPSEGMNALDLVEEPFADGTRDKVPQSFDEARLHVSRLIAMLDGPTFRTWGGMDTGHPLQDHADHAAAMLTAFNPKAAGRCVQMPLPSHYGSNGRITIDGKPIFAAPLNDGLLGDVPKTALLKSDPFVDYRLCAYGAVGGSSGELDAIARLRLLSEGGRMIESTKAAGKPLLKAGLTSRS